MYISIDIMDFKVGCWPMRQPNQLFVQHLILKTITNIKHITAAVKSLNTIRDRSKCKNKMSYAVNRSAMGDLKN